MRRKPNPPAPDLRAPWQIEQAARCGCRGSDDMCPCQNENPWPRPYIDWQARALKAEDLNRKLVEVVKVFLSADREALADHRPKWGLADCVDNTGQPYQSHFLATALTEARSLLSISGGEAAGEDGG